MGIGERDNAVVVIFYQASLKRLNSYLPVAAKRVREWAWSMTDRWFWSPVVDRVDVKVQKGNCRCGSLAAGI